MDESYDQNQDESHDYVSDSEDIYQQDDDGHQESHFKQLDLIKRKDSCDLKESCIIVRNFVIKNSTIKQSMTANPIKKLVSKKKHRFSLDGFNLDLTYITDQIIAMGFPADDIERYYRNSMEDVKRFFDTRHSGHFKVINLCTERKYDPSCFKGMVAEFPFDDHQAPTMNLLFSLCEELDSWLNKDKKNIAAIHCKAGKGRTGVMICCYLMYCKMFDNAYDSMRYYAFMRTDNAKGVTIPSQIRYIIYFQKCLNQGWQLKDIPVIPIRLTRIRLVTIPNLNYHGTCEPWFTIINGTIKYEQELEHGRKISQTDGCIDFQLDIVVQDDVRIQFFTKSVLDKYTNISYHKRKAKMFQFWFNTSFFDPSGTLIIDKFMLDGPVKDKAHKKFSANFRVELEGASMYHPSHKKYTDTSDQFNNGPYSKSNSTTNQINNVFFQDSRQHHEKL